MAGLDAGTPSAVAWPTLAAGLAGAIVVEDAEADRASRDLAALGVEAGESGAAGLAGLRALRQTTRTAPRSMRRACGRRSSSSRRVRPIPSATPGCW